MYIMYLATRPHDNIVRRIKLMFANMIFSCLLYVDLCTVLFHVSLQMKRLFAGVLALLAGKRFFAGV